MYGKISQRPMLLWLIDWFSAILRSSFSHLKSAFSNTRHKCTRKPISTKRDRFSQSVQSAPSTVPRFCCRDGKQTFQQSSHPDQKWNSLEIPSSFKEFKRSGVSPSVCRNFERAKAGTTSYEPFRKRPSADELLPSYFGTGGLPRGGLVIARISPPWKRGRLRFVLFTRLQRTSGHLAAFNFNFRLSTLSANFNYN